MRGIRVVPEAKERDRLSFAFMSNGVSSERQVETAVRQTAALVEQTRAQGKKVLVVAGPVVVHTGGATAARRAHPKRFRAGVLSGNALGVHDIEAALFGTSLGLRLSRRTRRKSTGTAITCAPSTRSIAAAACGRRSRAGA